MPIPQTTLFHSTQNVTNPSIALVRLLLADMPVQIFQRVMITRGPGDLDNPDLIAAERLPDGFRFFVQVGDEQLTAFGVDKDAAIAVAESWTLGTDVWRSTCPWQPEPKPDRAAKPSLIRIAYFDYDRTDCIGRYADGQFMALIHGYRNCPPHEIGVALLTFDDHGNLVRSDIRSVPLTDAQDVRTEMVAALPDVTLGPIAVLPFSVEALGDRWELVDESWEDMARFTMYPLDILFAAPFDGSYDT